MFTDVSVLNIQPSSVQLPSYTAPTKNYRATNIFTVCMTNFETATEARSNGQENKCSNMFVDMQIADVGYANTRLTDVSAL